MARSADSSRSVCLSWVAVCWHPPDAAQFYAAASPEIQNKLQILLSVWLREIASSTATLSAYMDEFSANAEARGVTPDTLAALLQ